MRPLAHFAGWALAAYVRLVAATCRPSGTVTQEQVVLAMWHEYNLVASVAAWRLRRGTRHVSFSTQTLRGEVMNAMLAGLNGGSVPLPAPGDRAGSAALTRELARVGRDSDASLVVAPDGPLGPYREAKPGALIVARESGLPLQTWAVTASPSFRLRRRWDRQIVPLPFCRLRVGEGESLSVEPKARLRPLLDQLQSELDRAVERAERPG